MNDDPEVLNPFGDRSSSSSPIDDVLDGPACCAATAVGIAQFFQKPADFTAIAGNDDTTIH